MNEAEVIVVGAGSAGAALAGRLSAGGTRVLLIEAGPRGAFPWTTIPIGYGKTFNHPRVNWMFRSQPIPGMGGRDNYFPRGKVLGGSSAINAMVYSRGQPSDFEEWKAAGNPGWGWDEVLACYLRMEDHDLGASEAHGAGGPVHVTDTSRCAHPATRAFVAAAAEAGLPFSPDLNGASIEGAGYYQITTRAGRRESSATAYLRKRPTLRIVTDCQVTRLLFEGRRAVGVEAMAPGGPVTYRAPRVVLSAGAVGTPILLQLSGVGPGALLADKGVPVVIDSPAVGRNLQDHLCHDIYYRARQPTMNQVLGSPFGQARAGLRWAIRRDGPLAASVNQGGGYYRTTPDRALVDMQLYFSPLTYEHARPGTRKMTRPDPFPGFCTSVSPCKPHSRGWIELSAPDWRAPPAIHPNYLDDPRDVADLVEGMKFLRRLARTPALSALIEQERRPGPEVSSDAALEADARARAYSVFHPCGTCRMGPDPLTSVVGPDLKLHGAEGLFVADASIFPRITCGNINAPSMMVGERAAELLG
ncbi:GMC family oxidoreductase [Frigidibacter sp. ROC022]|uniref:GMC family oxidoreductase n=1 Tax=Frigidibacter sp. ROC022 TaxID=2971796 RepID=UPI00215A4662|nr:GMC family oxidoreductase N-terminal domain-containing protein [Frigidibacter sp. ROC022]MCR8723310.1 GMC family oxidoreductase N-terminal domain-containing protein [Frigidibacter sp. ROC022]